MSLATPPQQLVRADGSVNFGRFNAPIPEVDLERMRFYGPLSPLARLRLKQWQHFAIIHPRVALTFAVVHAGFTKIAWVQVIDREKGTSWEHRREGLMLDLDISRSLWNEHTSVRSRDLRIDVHNHLDAGEHRIAIQADGGQAPSIDASLRCLHDLETIEPMVVSLPVGRGRAMYSHKVPLPVEGTLAVGGQVFELDPAECTAILDIHKAHYPRRTWWRWATFAGVDREGRRLAVNLTHNVVTDSSLNENAVWVDGKVYELGPARFDLVSSPWAMGTVDAAVDLTFEGQGERREDLNYGLIVSRFRQRFGLFSGLLRVGGQVYEVPELFGLAEDHTSVW